MSTVFERTLRRTFRLGAIGITVFSGLFFLYSLGGETMVSLSTVHLTYHFLSVRSDFVFDLLAFLVALFICLFSVTVICLTALGSSVSTYRDEVSLLAVFTGLGFGMGVLNTTVPATTRLLIALL
ncbi:hypothetical protein [Haladaptatus sp. W1]|uniref:hypothetical protein n=1 Tax=Haladaptatus sp. W1 TaxID=1897478 RepID=UPI000A97ABCA|nr:hypothetical protein [Haladaptatus sp. W1]